tara:strand:- start:544 stop:1146 length:603 start_codon:yes stop_codon:yes gene_type:complete
MVITIHQPEHFPYMGFFQKMAGVDLFIVLDDVKYRKNYFQNRNKFVNSTGTEEWFTVPVLKKCINKNINEVLVSPDRRWRKKIIKQLSLNFKVDLGEVYQKDNLLDINMMSIEYSREKLGITTPMMFSSEIGAKGSSSEKLANLCNLVGAKTYISGPSGRDYLDTSLFDDYGIKIEFFEPQVNNYYSVLYNLYTEGLLDE